MDFYKIQIHVSWLKGIITVKSDFSLGFALAQSTIEF
jgi:hypothetical protein